MWDLGNFSLRRVYTSTMQVPNPDSNLDHNPHGRGDVGLDSSPVCLRVNATNLDQDLDQDPHVNGALMYFIQRVLYQRLQCTGPVT